MIVAPITILLHLHLILRLLHSAQLWMALFVIFVFADPAAKAITLPGGGSAVVVVLGDALPIFTSTPLLAFPWLPLLLLLPKTFCS